MSSCSWWLLGRLVAGLRLRPGGRLVDIACGRGGPGLWLARAMSVRLTGIDFSAAAVELAAERADRFLRPGWAEFRRATFDRTGLPDEFADGAVSIDGLIFTRDRPAVLAEARRILKRGGRLVITVNERLDRPGGWQGAAESVGLEVEQALTHPHSEDQLRRMYALWREHESQLRAEIGDRATDNLMREAALVPPGLGDRRKMVLVLRRPVVDGRSGELTS